jgi:hypothetical protein
LTLNGHPHEDVRVADDVGVNCTDLDTFANGFRTA